MWRKKINIIKALNYTDEQENKNNHIFFILLLFLVICCIFYVYLIIKTKKNIRAILILETNIIFYIIVNSFAIVYLKIYISYTSFIFLLIASTIISEYSSLIHIKCGASFINIYSFKFLSFSSCFFSSKLYLLISLNSFIGFV